MHPQIVRSEPGIARSAAWHSNSRRLGRRRAEPELAECSGVSGSASSAIPVLVAAMGEMIPGQPLQRLASPRAWTWVQLILGSPVILWGGWPFFVRFWQSIVNRSLNMFTLIGLGVSVAYVYSLAATRRPRPSQRLSATTPAMWQFISRPPR